MELNGKKQNLSFFKLNQISQRYCKILFESNICADFKLSLSAKLSDHMSEAPRKQGQIFINRQIIGSSPELRRCNF